MKVVTQWFQVFCKCTLAGLLLVSAQKGEAGILSILKHGRPDGEGAPAAVEQETGKEWKRVAFVGSAKVKQVKGRVEVLTGIDRWSRLTPGSLLNPGDMIRTHDESRAILQMTQSGSLVALTPKTVMRLTEFEKGWDKAILSGSEESQGYTVRALRGTAEYKDSNKKWKAVAVNSVLPVGVKIRTESNTTMDLFHTGTGSFLRVNPDAELVLDPTIRYSARLVTTQSGPHLGGTKTAQISK